MQGCPPAPNRIPWSQPPPFCGKFGFGPMPPEVAPCIVERPVVPPNAAHDCERAARQGGRCRSDVCPLLSTTTTTPPTPPAPPPSTHRFLSFHTHPPLPCLGVHVLHTGCGILQVAASFLRRPGEKLASVGARAQITARGRVAGMYSVDVVCVAVVVHSWSTRSCPARKKPPKQYVSARKQRKARVLGFVVLYGELRGGEYPLKRRRPERPP